MPSFPPPRDVQLSPGDFRFGGDWRIETGPGLAPDDAAALGLREDLIERFQLQFQPRAGAGVVRLSIQPGSVAVGEALDNDKSALAEQAYRIDLSPAEVRITANAETGIFYGVETLAQLLEAQPTPGSSSPWAASSIGPTWNSAPFTGTMRTTSISPAISCTPCARPRLSRSTPSS